MAHQWPPAARTKCSNFGASDGRRRTGRPQSDWQAAVGLAGRSRTGRPQSDWQASRAARLCKGIVALPAWCAQVVGPHCCFLQTYSRIAAIQGRSPVMCILMLSIAFHCACCYPRAF